MTIVAMYQRARRRIRRGEGTWLAVAHYRDGWWVFTKRRTYRLGWSEA